MSETLDGMKQLSPRRNSTSARDLDELVAEQLDHFGINPHEDYGATLKRIVERMYESQADIEQLWRLTLQSMNKLNQVEKIQRFNSQKFLSFQAAITIFI